MNRVDEEGPARLPPASILRGLYAIADAGALQQRGLTPIAFAEAVLSVRPAALQLRAKNAPARETLALLRELASMCRRAAVPLVANDPRTSRFSRVVISFMWGSSTCRFTG